MISAGISGVKMAAYISEGMTAADPASVAPLPYPPAAPAAPAAAPAVAPPAPTPAPAAVAPVAPAVAPPPPMALWSGIFNDPYAPPAAPTIALPGGVPAAAPGTAAPPPAAAPAAAPIPAVVDYSCPEMRTQNITTDQFIQALPDTRVQWFSKTDNKLFCTGAAAAPAGDPVESFDPKWNIGLLLEVGGGAFSFLDLPAVPAEKVGAKNTSSGGMFALGAALHLRFYPGDIVSIPIDLGIGYRLTDLQNPETSQKMFKPPNIHMVFGSLKTGLGVATKDKTLGLDVLGVLEAGGAFLAGGERDVLIAPGRFGMNYVTSDEFSYDFCHLGAGLRPYWRFAKWNDNSVAFQLNGEWKTRVNGIKPLPVPAALKDAAEQTVSQKHIVEGKAGFVFEF